MGLLSHGSGTGHHGQFSLDSRCSACPFTYPPSPSVAFSLNTRSAPNASIRTMNDEERQVNNAGGNQSPRQELHESCGSSSTLVQHFSLFTTSFVVILTLINSIHRNSATRAHVLVIPSPVRQEGNRRANTPKQLLVSGVRFGNSVRVSTICPAR